MAIVRFLIDMGLFIGQSKAFFGLLHGLATAADAATREICAEWAFCAENGGDV